MRPGTQTRQVSSIAEARKIVAGIGLVLAIIASAAPGRADDSPQVGGPGGAPFDVSCKGSDLLVGFDAYTRDYVLALAAFCVPMQNGVLTGSAYKIGTFGGITINGTSNLAGPLNKDAPRCPANEALTKMRINLGDPGGYVYSFSMGCGRLNGQPGAELATTKNLPGAGGIMSSEDIACPPGQLANGVTGGYGTVIDRLGLKCTALHKAAPPPDAADGTPPPDSPPPDQATTRTAAEATTVYDKPAGNEIAYLDAGEAVTIVSCDGNGWCKISKPRKGYVWGDDLN